MAKKKKSSRGPKKMKKYESFDLWAEDQTLKHRKLIGLLRKFVKKAGPTLVESVKWGNGVFLGKKWPVIYLYADIDHLQFGFFNGAKLKDPKKLLKGKGQFVRHTKIYTPKDIDKTALTKLIRESTKLANRN